MVRAKAMFRALNMPVHWDGSNKFSAVLPNGSRVVGLPHVPDNIRGFAGAVDARDR
jgi:hypothetical protein